MSIDSTLPLTISFETTNRLSNVNIRPEKISKIIQTLDQNKAHGHDDISARMIKMCGSSIIKSLQLLFDNYVRQIVFPNIWKMANVLPVHKKSKQLVDNYRPVSLLPICLKIFEKLWFDSIYEFLDKNSLLNSHNLGFDLMTLVYINL